ncbi:MAG: hypothetical protein A2428_00915 [Bdellovibrionales bacterium RIFOXYC1_FULL_54_43]|nr:MAG: hypothetical protein A2428_00915 [Bdellovibrionales bacterium RIFOXYC1_FULL_54_43]OFZ82846.1 MAG: hypothetical protein A2603_11640 [Bdellovibrionales bacterium RIFOXYD1_FULL_55_31]
MTKNGVKDATSDEERIRQFWQSHPHSNIGIATGTSFGIALDIDPRHGGDKSLKEFEAIHGPLPRTVTAKTGGAGFHYIFKHPRKVVGNSVGILPGVDVRSDGGIIVVSPSKHRSGGTYEWLPGCAPGELELAEIPAPLLSLLTAKTDKTQQKVAGEKIVEGNRNDSLFRLGCKLVRVGLTFEAIRAALTEENRTGCVPPLTDEEVRSIASGVMRYSPHAVTWMAPLSLPNLEPDVPELIYEMLPPSLAPWIADVSERMQVPLDFLAASSVVAASALIGRRAQIFPKAEDSWAVVPNLWGMVISPPGTKKSPSIGEGVKTTNALQKEAFAKYRKEKIEFDGKKKTFEKKIKELEAGLSDGGLTSDQTAALEEELAEAREEAENKPVLQAFITNDATIEKLHQILSENPFGVLIFRDELTGFLMNLEKKGREGDRQFYLEAWSGDSPYKSDRVIRDTTFAEVICVSILGGIQYDRLEQYFEQVFSRGSGDDGLLARFQLMVWPKRRSAYEYIDRAPNQDAAKKADKILRELASINKALLESIDCDKSIKLRFTDDAQALFVEWYTALERRLCSGCIESSAFEAHLSKYRSLMPSLALIFHLIEVAAGSTCEMRVSLDSTKLAARWCAYLEAHARKAYSPVISPHIRAAHLLVKKIKSGEVCDGMATRDIYRKGWSGLDSPELVQMALKVLAKYQWVLVSELRSPNGGPPSEIVHINPAVREKDDSNEETPS